MTKLDLLRTSRRCRLSPKNGLVGTPVLICVTRGVNPGCCYFINDFTACPVYLFAYDMVNSFGTSRGEML